MLWVKNVVQNFNSFAAKSIIITKHPKLIHLNTLVLMFNTTANFWTHRFFIPH